MPFVFDRRGEAGSGPWPDEPVPISLVITDLDPGGAEKILVALATRLDRRRWQPRVVSLSAPGVLEAELRRAGIEVASLDVDRRRPVAAVRRLAAELRRQGPRIVQSFLFHANVASRLAGMIAGRPPVVGGVRVAEREKRWHLRLERMTRRLGVGAVCVSAGVAEFMRTEGGWPADSLVVIPNGIDLERIGEPAPLSREELGLGELDRPVVFVGRIEAQKDLPTLLEAAKLVAREREDWRLLIVGEGPDRPFLQGRAEGDPVLSRAVRWLGFREDVPRLLATAEAFVLPSLWEGMPNALMEAMAVGRAVVATDVEGSRELVVPGETGWLVPAGDAGALAGALIEAHDRDDPRDRFGRAGRARIREDFNLDEMVRRYEACWAGVLGLDPLGD